MIDRSIDSVDLGRLSPDPAAAQPRGRRRRRAKAHCTAARFYPIARSTIGSTTKAHATCVRWSCCPIRFLVQGRGPDRVEAHAHARPKRRWMWTRQRNWASNLVHSQSKVIKQRPFFNGSSERRAPSGGPSGLALGRAGRARFARCGVGWVEATLAAESTGKHQRRRHHLPLCIIKLP